MGWLKGVMTAQALVLLVYGFPYLLIPRYATVFTQQPPLPENYFLRTIGIAFVILAYLELKIVRDLERYRGLTLAYALLPALFVVTIILQTYARGFVGASWFWWLNGVISGGFTLAMFAAHWSR